MRRISWLASVPFVLAAACGSIPDPPGGGGDGGGGGTDGGPTTGSVTVSTKKRDTTPAIGTDVVLQGQDGSVIRHVVTDASGTVTLDDVAAGSMVTVVFVEPVVATNPPGYYLQTISGVKPGDNLTFVAPFSSDPSTELKAIDVSWASPGSVTVNEYRISAGCYDEYASATSTSARVAIYSHCAPAGSTTPLVIVALDSNQVPVAYATATVDLSVDAPMVNFASSAWRTDFAQVQLNLNNAPANAFELSASLETFAGGRSFLEVEKRSPVAPGGSLGINLAYPRGVFDAVGYRAFLKYEAGGAADGSFSLYFARTSSIPASAVNVDLSAVLLPRITSPMLQEVSGRRQLSFTVSGDISGVDAGFAQIIFRREGPYPRYDWWLLFPPTQPMPVVLPLMPDSLSSYVPPAGIVPSFTPVIVMESDVIDGYDDMRNSYGIRVLGEEIFFAPDFVLRASVAGQAG